ncbi:hypothetical protein PMIN06_004127 [Paraphaeosphaeria minitans]
MSPTQTRKSNIVTASPPSCTSDITSATVGTTSLELTLQCIHRQVTERLAKSLGRALVGRPWRQGHASKAWCGLALLLPALHMPQSHTPAPADAGNLRYNQS